MPGVFSDDVTKMLDAWEHEGGDAVNEGFETGNRRVSKKNKFAMATVGAGGLGLSQQNKAKVFQSLIQDGHDVDDKEQICQEKGTSKRRPDREHAWARALGRAAR